MKQSKRPKNCCYTLWVRNICQYTGQWYLVCMSDKVGCCRAEQRIKDKTPNRRKDELEYLIMPPDEVPSSL